MVKTTKIQHKWKMSLLDKNMYNNIISRIVTPDGNSAFFPCCKGVRQGGNLPPILFSLYLNDLRNYLMANGANGIVCEANSENIYEGLNGVPLKSLICKIWGQKSIFSKMYAQISLISKILAQK